MITNYRRTMSPEMRPEDARLPYLAYSADLIKNALVAQHPKIKSIIAGVQVVREQLKVPAVIDYTTEQTLEINPELISSDVSLAGYDQHISLLQAEQAVKQALEEAERQQYGLAA